VKTLLEFMLGLPGGGGCVNHCFIVSSGFVPHPVLHRVVQVRLQFLMPSVVYVYMYVCTRHVCQLLLHLCTTLSAG
jgi:hypothetical protein